MTLDEIKALEIKIEQMKITEATLTRELLAKSEFQRLQRSIDNTIKMIQDLEFKG